MRKTAIGVAAVLALTLVPGSVLAQDDMAADDMTTGSMAARPSMIHAGDCSAIGDVVAQLSDSGVIPNDAEGADSYIHVDQGISTVEMSLDDLLASDKSIVIHNSADDLGTIIACGAIGGHDVDGSFVVGIGPVGDSGFSGIAWLTDNGDGTTDFNITITKSGAAESMAVSADVDMSSDDDMDSKDKSDDDMSSDDDMDSKDKSDDDMDSKDKDSKDKSDNDKDSHDKDSKDKSDDDKDSHDKDDDDKDSDD